MAKWGEIKCREAASKCPRCEELSNCVAVLEAKLARGLAVLEFLKFIDENYRHLWADMARKEIQALHAELKGGKDE